jgi:GH15 family glucan-1,4-alpha-glucosidase
VIPERAQRPIGDYAVISDQRTAALVARDGAIDWMCAPRFDDEPMLDRLLDPGRGGAIELRPTAPGECERRYVEGTNILETEWTTASGSVLLTDALVVAAGMQRFSQLVRRVECLAGEVELAWAVRPRLGWEAAVPGVRRSDEGVVLAHGAIEMLVQSHDLGEPCAGDGEATGRATLATGRSGLLTVLFTHDFPLLGGPREDAERRLRETAEHWHAWLAPLRYDGPWRARVERSALALAACVHDETGAMVAAPTTSLPERVGGDRNYDYRYCWVRDTSFALDASLRLGLSQLAQATLGWLLRSGRRTHPRIAVFFTLDGDPFLPQHDVDVPGYRGSLPVRVGNDAGSQLQLGTFSDLMETAWLFVRSGSTLHHDASLRLGEVADYVCAIWQQPDSGVWELDERRRFTGSRVACWTTLERALRLHEAGQLATGDPGLWRTTMGSIQAWVRERCVAPDGTFLRDGDGSEELDCVELLMPRRDFLGDDTAGFARTVDRIRTELSAGGPLLYRYSGQAGKEGAFVACSFWLVQALTSLGRFDDAAALMDELAGVGNDLGLMSEEVDPSDGSLLGNFPLCLSHLSLLNAAAGLAEAS